MATTALLLLSAGVHGASPPPPSNSTAGALANFSASTAAASFAGLDSLTFIGCEGFDDAREADRACVKLLGHARGQCNPFPAYGNATLVPICRCITYAGLTPPGNCVDATCVLGADACSVRQWPNYVGVVLHSFAVLLTAYTFGFGLYAIAVGRKNLKLNSMTATLVFTTLSTMFHLLWRFSEFLGYAVLLSTVPGTDVQKPIAIPGFVLCGLIGVLTFPLQWLGVAKKTARIKSSRGGSSNVPHIAVTVAAFVLAAAFVSFAVTGQVFLISGAFPETHRGCVKNPRRAGNSARGTSTRTLSFATHTPHMHLLLPRSSRCWVLLRVYHHLLGGLLQTHKSSRIPQQNGPHARHPHPQRCDLPDVLRSIFADMCVRS